LDGDRSDFLRRWFDQLNIIHLAIVVVVLAAAAVTAARNGALVLALGVALADVVLGLVFVRELTAVMREVRSRSRR
jgi:uncharacterized membrane protein